MAGDQYDFEGQAGAEELARLAAKLAGATKKDALAKLLKQAGDLLEKAPQDVSAALGDAGDDLAAALARPAVLQHADKDVRLHAGFCLAHLLRVWAPEVPYDDEQLAVREQWCFLWRLYLARGGACALSARALAVAAARFRASPLASQPSAWPIG